MRLSDASVIDDQKGFMEEKKKIPRIFTMKQSESRVESRDPRPET